MFLKAQWNHNSEVHIQAQIQAQINVIDHMVNMRVYQEITNNNGLFKIRNGGKFG